MGHRGSKPVHGSKIRATPASPVEKGTQTATEELWDSVTRAVTEIAKSSEKADEDVAEYAVAEVMKLARTAANAAVKTIQIAKERDEHTRAPIQGNVEEEQSRKIGAVLQMLQEQLLFLEIAKVAMEGREQHKSKFKSLRKVGDQAIVHPWTKKKELGKGAYGVVYSAVDKTGFEFAVKQVSRRGVEEKSVRDEVKILNILAHRNIVTCYGCAGDEDYIYMYMELMQGSIDDKMMEQGEPLAMNNARRYTRDVLKGLIYLHSKGIVHRDIKCPNVLLDSAGTAKLADMGISKIHEEETLLQYESQAGTLFWMSPEAIESKTTGKRSDVWSLGCTVYEMVKGFPPFMKELTGSPLMIPLRLPKLIFELEHRKLVGKDESLGPALQNFLLRIFVKMDGRPYADGIAEHPWVR